MGGKRIVHSIWLHGINSAVKCCDNGSLRQRDRDARLEQSVTSPLSAAAHRFLDGIECHEEGPVGAARDPDSPIVAAKAGIEQGAG
jgi:hypothetical protein